MPGLPRNRPIKGLNKAPGRKRFVFKSFAQRVEEVDLDVFRSLTPLKLEPTTGTSLFHESLVSWRELNSTAEFTAAYEILLPIVQTMPQLILHKEFVINTLISHLQSSSSHSLEPILSLIAVLSRDLQSDFILFIPQIFGAYVNLLQSGADREPEIIEQIFTSLSYIFKFLQKNLCKDIKFILKATRGFRYYKRLYIQEFTAEAVSYLLRNSSHEQLIKGVRRLLIEVHLKPSKENINSCGSLLWCTLKGPGRTLHSRANSVLRLLLDKSTFTSMRRKDPGGQVIVEVLSDVVYRLCEELDRDKTVPVWSCLLDELNCLFDEGDAGSFKNKHIAKVIDLIDLPTNMDMKSCDHSVGVKSDENGSFIGKKLFEQEEKASMANLLALLNLLLEFRKGSLVYDFQPLFSLACRLLQPSLLKCGEQINDLRDVACSLDTGQAKVHCFYFQVWRFVVNLIKSYTEVTGSSTVLNGTRTYALLWTQIWKCLEFESLVYVVQELLKHGESIIHLFVPDILRMFNALIHTQPLQILTLAVQIFEYTKGLPSCANQRFELEGLFSFLVSTIKDATAECRNCVKAPQLKEAALIWAALKCYGCIVKFHEHDRLLVWSFILALDQLLTTAQEANCNFKDSENQKLWEFILATGLSTELDILSNNAAMNLSSRAGDYLNLVVRYKNSPFVLRSVADFLDLCLRESASFKQELVPGESEEGQALSLLEKNLGSQNKMLRLSTLRLLIHLEKAKMDDVVVAKRRKTLDGGFSKEIPSSSDAIFEQLRSIEEAPYSLDAGRQSALVLTQLKIIICTGSLSDYLLTSLTHAMIGIFSNRFSLLWDSAVDCLSGLLETRKTAVWETFKHHLDFFHTEFLNSLVSHPKEEAIDRADESLVSLMKLCQHDDCESTDVGTLVTLMLKAAQKAPTMSEARTRQLIPVFLTFIGQDSESESLSMQGNHLYGGKDWKLVLKEWLMLLSLMKNAQSYFKSASVKEVLINRFLMDSDPEIQLKALECILNWKDGYLIPYEDHLKNLIAPKTAREEMTTWNVGTDSDSVQLGHRDHLVSILLRILFPKILKTKTSLHNKTTSGIQRKVVLAFLASLEVHELSLFFILILKPLEGAFKEDGMALAHEDRAWELAIKQGVHHDFIEWVDIEGIAKLSHKKKIGFLHMLKDILETFDKDHIAQYLHACLGFTFRILDALHVDIESSANASASTGPNPGVLSGKKDIRTLFLKVLAIVLNKYEATVFTPTYWDIFFRTVRPMILRFADEGASGDGPSALFSCLLAMSRSIAFVSILQKEDETVPNLLPLLSHKNASASVVGAALSFVENILSLEEEDAGLIKQYFLIHLPLLLSHLRSLLSLQPKGMRKVSMAMKRALHILLKLGRHIGNAEDADQLLNTLLPFMQKQKNILQEDILNVLRVLKEIAPSLSVRSCEQALPFLGQHLSSSSNLDVRSVISQVLLAFSLANGALSFVAGLISDLNSLSPSTVGEYDYERRVEAYSLLIADSFGKLTYEQALLVISQAFYDVDSNDLSIRHSASNCLSTFIQFLALRYQSSSEMNEGREVAFKEELCSNDNIMVVSTEKCLWDLEAIRNAVQKLFLPQIRKSMSLETISVRREWVSLLKEMALNLPAITPFSELVPLINADAEVDFFNNINHIQTHRRIRAMSRFKELCQEGTFSQGILVRIFEPLFTNSLFEAKSDKDGNLVQSAIEVIATIAGNLEWEPYNSLLMRIFRMISSHPEHEKVIVKLLCSVLDKFHFGKASMSLASSPNESCPREEGCKILIREMDASVIPQEIVQPMKLHILPKLTKLMLSKGNMINVPVSLAVVKVLQLMPCDVMELELPRIIQSIVNLLKNRNHVVRDEARAGLVAVVGCLGAGYFGFVVEKLCDSLKRGYELHVLGFTMNALISRIFPKLKVGEIDYCAEKIVNVLVNDIFEDLADEKEVEKMALKMKEIKRSGSYESLKLVAQMLTFRVHGSTILQPITRRLKDALIPKVKGKIERTLRQLAVGIQYNSSLQQEDLFIFIHGLIKDGNEASLPHNGSSGHKSGDTKENISSHHLITEFALQLFEKYLKKAKINKRDPSVLSMLDPLVVLLQDCLESRHGAILGLALKCLCHLVRLPLPTLELSGSALLDKILAMAQGLVKFDNQDARPCFNLLVNLLKHAKSAHISEDQLRTILKFPVFIDLEKAETNDGLFILKAIVGRKLLVPEVYDIIKNVFQLMVTSHVAIVRKYSSEIALQFLLDYPLGSRRLQQHLDFLIANLSYSHESGREAVLEMLHAIIVKFPAQAVDEQLESLFLPLVIRLVNDESNQLRAMVGTILKVLMSRVSDRSLQRMLQFGFSWLKGDKQQLWRAAGQVLGFAVEVMGVKYRAHMEESLTLSSKILSSVLDLNGVGKTTSITTAGAMLWQEAYYILTMLEKLFKQFPEVFLQRSHERLWEIIICFLVHQHVWVCKASSRLLDMYFASCNSVDKSMEAGFSGNVDEKVFLLQPSRLMQLAAILCQQISSELDEDFAALIKTNLLFISGRLHHTCFQGRDRLSWMDFACEKDASSQLRVAEALDILKVQPLISKQNRSDVPGGRNRERMVKDSDRPNSDGKYFGLYPVFKYLQRVSLQGDELQIKTVFNLYASLLAFLGKDGIRPYLSSMLLPLYRTVEAVSAMVVTADVKTCAESVLDQIRETVGTEDFVRAYNETRQTAKITRETRNRSKKLRVLLDPEGHSRQKLRLNAKRQIQKKKRRKILRDARG